MLQIHDIVKRQKHSKKLYKVIGFDNPLPFMGGEVIIILKEVGKKTGHTKACMSRLYNEDGTKIF